MMRVFCSGGEEFLDLRRRGGAPAVMLVIIKTVLCMGLCGLSQSPRSLRVAGKPVDEDNTSVVLATSHVKAEEALRNHGIL